MWLSTSVLLCLIAAGADEPAPVVVDTPNASVDRQDDLSPPLPVPYKRGVPTEVRGTNHEVVVADCEHCRLRHRCCRCGCGRLGAGSCPSCGRMLHAWLFGSCDMPQRVEYILQEPDTYYFRPYNVVHVPQHQNLVRSVGGDPRHPYINTIFERVYEEWEAEQAAQTEVIPAPKGNGSRSRNEKPADGKIKD